ncbi:MAG: arabinose efflux permease family protein [Firmicutes bacterium]|nr:arabinose efflux permease family protein [Bacillota bacterium]
MGFLLNMTKRQKTIFPLLILGALFEGFDDTCVNVLLPFITKEFGISTSLASMGLSIVAIGTMLSFFVVRLADTYGRKPIFLNCVYGYSIASILSAFAPDPYVLVALQMIARIFLIGCWSVGFIIISEEFTTAQRGTAIATFQLMATFGTFLVALLLSVMDYLPWGWRTLFVVGGFPLIPVYIYRNRLFETERFLKVKEALLRGEDVSSANKDKKDMFAIWKPPYGKYVFAMALVWIFLYFGIKGGLNFFAMHAIKDLHWTTQTLSHVIMAQAIVGLGIMFANGKMLDRIGRKAGATIVIIMGVCASIGAFMLTEFWIVVVAACCMQGFKSSYLIVGSTITNELFPAKFRSNATAWANNILGRLGQVFVPTVVGILSLYTSFGTAVAIAVAIPILALLIIWALPESSTIAKQNDIIETNA